MLYHQFQDLKLSALGLGAMRLPVVDGDDAKIDAELTAKMVDYAMSHGVNYYDTAWGYHMGNSETVLGNILKNYPRANFYLADKFPGYDLSNMPRVAEIFEQQLKKCGVDYFDFYLFHNVCELNIDGYLNPAYRIFEYLMEQKRNGRIRHLGFSTHGNLDIMQRFLEAYGEHMEFCQIQLNYIDWSFQNAEDKIKLLNQYHIPVWVMEPLRGGKLAKLPESAEKTLSEMRPEESVPGWAFRFLQGIPEVTVTLSGMSTMEQLAENIETYAEQKPLTETELQTLLGIAGDMMHNVLPCTACRYCTNYCPQKLDIPHLLALYNEHHFTGGGFLAPMALSALPAEKQPQACIGCRSCEKVCPQQIKISEAMANFCEMLK